MTECIRISALFDLSHTLARPLLERFTYPWEVLPEIKNFILALGPTLPEDEYEQRPLRCQTAPRAWIFR